MYSIPDISQPIRQGDIFRWLPKLELMLGPANLPEVTHQEEEGMRMVDWLALAKSDDVALANVFVRPTLGIVITQDCDASRSINITFAEIKPFDEIEGSFNENLQPKKFVSYITKQSQRNQKWYYLAEHPQMGFYKKMGVDFQSVFEVSRDMLDSYIEQMRLGRLEDEVAWPHFRERVSDFFRRYPYNEWYSFNTEEVKAYEENHKSIVDPHYPWQIE